MHYLRLALIVGLACRAEVAVARGYTFDPALLNGADIDVSMFDQGGQLPGTYPVDILLNGERVDTADVVFTQGKDAAGRSSLVPCLSVAQLARYGLKTEDFPDLSSGGVSSGCARLSAVPGLQTSLDTGTWTLSLLIPQALLRSRLQGVAPEALWSDGVPAFLMNWQANTSETQTRGAGADTTQASYAQIQPGANIGPWRLRNASTWQKNSGSGNHYESAYTYAERGLNTLKSRITLGERYTPSDIFDSVPFRGAMLSSDESMVPGGASTYAPVVRGIATTQARVEVKQNGYILYSGMVAPGPFALTDLTPTGSGGDMEVTVYEADGTNQVFTVPYQTPAIALREGYLQYNLMAGQYRAADRSVDRNMVYQATAIYGLPWDLTLYSGTQLSDHYQAASIGGGISMGDWGAMSVDTTETRGQRRHEETEKGHNWRVRYSKQVISTSTTFTLASYQYASTGYSTLSDVLDTWRSDGTTYNTDRRRTRTALTVSQAMGDLGYINLTGSRDSYWNRPGHNDSLNAAYSVSLGDVVTSLSWTENRSTNSSGRQYRDRVASLWLSIPLERWTGSNTTASLRYTQPSSGADTYETGLSGRAIDRRLYWDVRERYRPGATGGDTNNNSVRLSWSGAYGQVGGSYSQSQNLRQSGLDASGGMIIHPQGVTFGQALGDTVALVEAPGASNISVGGWPGVRTDWRGYTTLAYMNPYQENLVTLNPAELPPDAEITQTDTRVIPTRGAVIPARFATRIGGRALITLIGPDGSPVKYGSVATLDTHGFGTGVVGEGGVVYLTGLPQEGYLTVKWSGGQCRANFTLPTKTGKAGLYEMRAQCR